MAGVAREPNQLNETLERMARACLNFAIRHPAHLAVMFSHYPASLWWLGSKSPTMAARTA